MIDSTDRQIKVNGVKSGLILGVILVSLSIFSFYFITEIAASPIVFVAAPLLFSLILPIALVIFFCFNERKKLGGYWTFKQATTGIFIMFLAAYVIQTIGRDIIFARLVEPHMVQKTEAAAINATTIMMKKANQDQKQIDKNIVEIRRNFDDQKDVTIGKMIQGIAISIIFIFFGVKKHFF